MILAGYSARIFVSTHSLEKDVKATIKPPTSKLCDDPDKKQNLTTTTTMITVLYLVRMSRACLMFNFNANTP